jgi:hypothetical protein
MDSAFRSQNTETCESENSDTLIINNDKEQQKSWRVISSGIWLCVVRRKSTNNSEEHVASIFRAEIKMKQAASRAVRV